MAVEKSPTRLEGARQHGLLRCQPGCAKSLEQSLSTCKPKCVPYTPLPTDSLGSLYIHCSGPAKIIKHNNFHKAAGWNLQQVVRAMENPCDSDMHETTHCSEGSHSGEYSLPYWLRYLAFLLPAVCRSPSSTWLWALPLPRQSRSHNPPVTLWAGIGQALPHLTSVSGNKKVQAQTSAKIITGIVWPETAAHFHLSIGWKKRDKQVCGLSLQILFQDSNCCIIHILVFTCLPCVPEIPLNSLWVFPSSPLHVTVFPNCTNTNKPRVQY